MQAMVLHDPADAHDRPLRAEDRPVPEPGPRELLVRVAVCGVCHTDLHEVEGDIHPPKLPIIPGHQAIGTVERLGEGAGRFAVGDRVGVAWLAWTCGECDLCTSGRENLCDKARYTGFSLDGGYARFARVHEEFAYAIPEGIADRDAAPLLCAGIIGYRALQRARVGAGEILGMIGFGASAHVAIQVAVHRGCTVFVWSRGEHHRELARELGAAWCGGPDDDAPDLCHGIINFTPAGGTVAAGMARLRPGGTQSLAGITMSPVPRLDYERHLYHEKTLTSVQNNTRADGREMLALAAEIPIRTTTQTYPLADANEALIAMANGTINGAAVLEI